MANPKRSYAELLDEIESLKKQAEAMRKAELGEIIADIKRKIQEYQLTAQDLGLSEQRRAPARAKDGRGAVKPKYRDPASGKTWTGRGRQPIWFRDALASGSKPEALAISEG